LSRPARAVIDLSALQHNYRLARQRHGRRVLAVIKANAYGHGAMRCAHALAGLADGFAVAVVEEAVALRGAGITGPILVLEGAFGADDLQIAHRHALWMVVHDKAQIAMLEASALREPLGIWLKVNSGMNRAGLAPGDVQDAYARLQRSGRATDIVLMTHLARADEPACDATPLQLQCFDRATAGLPGERSVANSGGILGWPEAHRDWARAGIMLYGADPMPGDANGLRPAMTLASEIMAVREIEAGAPLGYGARFKAPRRTRVGLVAMGYADGYPRAAPDGTPVAVGGRLTRLIGRVSMDMLMVDLSDLPEAGPGTAVDLWGGQVSVNQVAEAGGTISYELLCNVKRVRFDYLE
jgi:alanine racemase